MDIGWPQLIYLGLSFLSLGIVIANNGKPREPYNAGSYALGLAITYPLLWWGGFFH